MSRDVKRLWNLASLWSRPRPTVGVTPADVVLRENKWRLLRYRPRPEGVRYRTPLVLVPSLINRHYVLDLMPGKSLAAFLVAEGHDVYVIDWGTPGPEDRFLTLDDFAGRYLGRVLRWVAAEADGVAPHVLGYCMGGTLVAIHAAVWPERLASFVALAAPVTFGDDGLLAAWTRSPAFDVRSLTRAFGNVPWQLMQSAFHMLRPTLTLAKATHVLDRAWEDEYLDGFLALETWGNDNVAFPGACFERYIEDLYRSDALARGELRVDGRRADLGAITCPTLAVTFAHDNIVPAASAAALVDRVGAADKDRIHLSGGHVGAVVSRKASQSLWPTLSQWWADRDAPA